MPNVLTGDFDAILELSGGTLNRLLATMHQNAGPDSGKPSLPHIAYFRLGNDRQVPGVHGSVAAQIGVPHVELIHGASDCFRLYVDIRARYRADPGTGRRPRRLRCRRARWLSFMRATVGAASERLRSAAGATGGTSTGPGRAVRAHGASSGGRPSAASSRPLTAATTTRVINVSTVRACGAAPRA
jgi:hypothetical protein